MGPLRRVARALNPVPSVVVLATIAAAWSHGMFQHSAIVAFAQPQSAGAPRFELDKAWPHVPEKWKLGFISSVTVDSQDHVWVLHRPRTLAESDAAQAAPPVLEFDNAGTFIQAWGGPGTGYEWPEREHGISFDHKGNVWIGGNNYPARQDRGLKRVSDDQLLNFSRTGKLLAQLGHSNQSGGNADTKNFHQPTDVAVWPKTNEMFVADGYGNHRVIVLDADTGAFKRMWGAFGNKPVDTPARGPEIPPSSIPDDGSPGSPQFDIVHAIRISNDGLVYVADRENKRIQVFTIEGKYVSQVFVRRSETAVPRTTSGLALSPGPQQQFLYTSALGGPAAQLVILDRKSLKVVGAIGSAEGFTGGHQMAADSKGNLYTALGNRPSKFAYKGVSPTTSRSGADR
jgi:DNA-binding beta-propeller fold protein YncE